MWKKSIITILPTEAVRYPYTFLIERSHEHIRIEKKSNPGGCAILSQKNALRLGVPNVATPLITELQLPQLMLLSGARNRSLMSCPSRNQKKKTNDFDGSIRCISPKARNRVHWVAIEELSGRFLISGSGSDGLLGKKCSWVPFFIIVGVLVHLLLCCQDGKSEI